MDTALVAKMLHEQQLGILTFLGVLCLIAMWNILTIRRFGDSPPVQSPPMVSILVPARNEALNIEACLDSLLHQDYAPYEVIILDDESEDATPLILNKLAVENRALTILSGQPLPPGWLGKNWACHQLSQAAQGELLLFVDADTRHHPGMLNEAVSSLTGSGADLLSGLPHQQLKSWGERIILPFFAWATLSFFPIRLLQWLPFAWMAVAVGQFILIRKRAYLQSGGHSAIRGRVNEDIALAQLIKKNRLSWEFVKLDDKVSCRMYRDFSQVVDGFGRSLFAVFGSNPPIFLMIWIWLVIVFVTPALGLLLYLFGASPGWFSPGLGLAAVLTSAVLWLACLAYYRLPLSYAVGYPLTIALTGLAIGRSAWLHFCRGSLTWKGRELKTKRHPVKP